MPSTWHTKTSIRAQWSNAPKTDALLDDLLDTAQDDVLTMARWSDAEIPTDIAPRWRYAQLLQARALWEIQHAPADDSSEMGGEYRTKLYPFSAAIRRVVLGADDVMEIA